MKKEQLQSNAPLSESDVELENVAGKSGCESSTPRMACGKRVAPDASCWNYRSSKEKSDAEPRKCSNCGRACYVTGEYYCSVCSMEK